MSSQLPTIGEVGSLSVGKLKAALRELSVDMNDCLEKSDYQDKLRSALEARSGASSPSSTSEEPRATSLSISTDFENVNPMAGGGKGGDVEETKGNESSLGGGLANLGAKGLGNVATLGSGGVGAMGNMAGQGLNLVGNLVLDEETVEWEPLGRWPRISKRSTAALIKDPLSMGTGLIGGLFGVAKTIVGKLRRKEDEKPAKVGRELTVKLRATAHGVGNCHMVWD